MFIGEIFVFLCENKYILMAEGYDCGRVMVATIQKETRDCSRASKMAATYSPTIRSTIGDAELNDPVRNGKGWDLSAITT